MEVKRVILGSHPSPNYKSIPDICERSRTIYKSQLDVLFMFKDKRLSAQAWINEMLPTFCLGIPAEKLRELFWSMPEGSWYEFDYGRKTLSFCSLIKK